METMTKQQLTEDVFPTSFGAFKPVGHVVVALPDDDTAADMARQLHAHGFLDGSIQRIPAAVMDSKLTELLQATSGAAGFGSEIQSMRRYQELAQEGCGFLVVKAEDEELADEVAKVGRQHDAKVAVSYGRLLVQTLI